jgi:hypothetical protein
MFATVFEAREMVDKRYVMRIQLMVYRDQEADTTWMFPDAFVCTRR